LFPAWVRIGTPATGIEALGQQVLSTTGSWALLLLTLTVPGALGTVTFFTLAGTSRAVGWIGAVAGGLGAVVIEVLELVRWLGGAFERLEPGAIRG
jgi:hypothetical protein